MKKMFKRRKHISQLQFIALGFIILIIIGGLLLNTPYASRSGESAGLFNSIFTATSAICVTGLVVFDTSTQWSLFGQIIILIMIQIGGLGFISIGVFFAIVLKKRIGLGGRGLIKESTNSLHIGGAVKLMRKIIFGTALFEVLGAVILSTRLIPEFGLLKGIWFSIFHSISAFCNAGFDLMGAKHGEYASLLAYSRDFTVNIVIMILIVVGGLGFIVWDDVSTHKFALKQYRLHTKIVFFMTFILIIGGAIIFAVTERAGVLSDKSGAEVVLSTLFSSVTARTAGFNTLDFGLFSNAGKLFFIIIMYIGGSPGSTAGGIKTTTFFVLLTHVKANIENRYSVEAFGRRLKDDAIRTATTIGMINLSLIIVAVFVMCCMEEFSVIDLFFEVTSAVSTVGVSTGITRDLSMASKCIIILLMYLGRVGSLSFALAFTRHKKIVHLSSPHEDIRIG